MWRRPASAGSPEGCGDPAWLIERAPFRESGYRLLMEAKAARGNVAEALHAYERLRVLLREELGVAPSPVVQAVHRRLLQSAADWCGPALL
jgi:DNA-binding SARP family transcriptional activator